MGSDPYVHDHHTKHSPKSINIQPKIILDGLMKNRRIGYPCISYLFDCRNTGVF